MWYDPTSLPWPLAIWCWLVGWAFLPINYCSFLSLQSCREKKRIMAQFWAFNGRCPLFAFLTAGRKDLEIAAFHRRSNSKLNISWLDASLLLVQHSRCTAQKNITFLSSHQGRNWWGHLVIQLKSSNGILIGQSDGEAAFPTCFSRRWWRVLLSGCISTTV